MLNMLGSTTLDLSMDELFLSLHRPSAPFFHPVSYGHVDAGQVSAALVDETDLRGDLVLPLTSPP